MGRLMNSVRPSITPTKSHFHYVNHTVLWCSGLCWEWHWVAVTLGCSCGTLLILTHVPPMCYHVGHIQKTLLVTSKVDLQCKHDSITHDHIFPDKSHRSIIQWLDQLWDLECCPLVAKWWGFVSPCSRMGRAWIQVTVPHVDGVLSYNPWQC